MNYTNISTRLRLGCGGQPSAGSDADATVLSLENGRHGPCLRVRKLSTTARRKLTPYKTGFLPAESLSSSHALRHAFTLIELLVVVGIISILATLGLGAGQGAMLRARKIREVAAAKNLITGFVSTPDDFNGQYLLGYDAGSSAVTGPGGEIINGELAHRYPYRLAPYFGWQLQGTILVNSNNRQVGNDRYQISLNPAMGMNIYLVGGDLHDAATGLNYPTECVRRPGTSSSEHLLVFASAGFDNLANNQHTDGYFRVNPPKLGGTNWKSTKWTPQSKAADYGQVDARYAGQAVCAFLDGSVQSLSVEDLRDMRLWSTAAAAGNDPNYNPTNTNSGGGPGM